MKKWVGLIVAFLLAGATLPTKAAVNLYRADDGQLVLEATTCYDVARVSGLVGLPDDPPENENPSGLQEEPQDISTDDTNPTDNTEQSAKKVNPLVVKSIQMGADILLSDDNDPSASKNRYGISEQAEDMLDAVSFEERQDSFITFVRDVNWKTGMYITFRDFSVWRRLKMACSGINQLSKPFRMNLGLASDELDQTIQKATNTGVDALAQAALGHSFAAMSKLSVVGWAMVIEKENPFLLLAVDEETYNKLVEVEPKIAKLFEDMYTFFKIRAVRMGEFNNNIKDLLRVSRIGKGDSFSTWHVMAEYAKKMLELERQDKLNPDDEKQIHIWRLESSMYYIREQVRVEKRAAELAAQDPANAVVLAELEKEPKKKPSLDDKARELLQKSTQAEIKRLIRKYVKH